MNIKWDAEDYKDSFSFVPDYGADVTELLTVEKGGRIMDLGCGGGALEAVLLSKGYTVTGVDASEDMLKVARKVNPSVEFIQKDASKLDFENEFDGVFSNAVFHWIDDQNSLLKGIYRALKTGGQLVCEFGGKGCAETVHRELERLFEKRGMKYKRTFYFPTIGEYTPIMENNGLTVTYAVLFDRKTYLKGDLISWINMFDKAPFDGVEEHIADEIKKEAQENLKNVLWENGKWFVDYVRIRIKAEKR